MMLISCFCGVTIGGVLFMKHLNSKRAQNLMEEIADNEQILQSVVVEKQYLSNQLETLLNVKIDENLIDKLVLLLQEENETIEKDYDDSNVSEDVVLK